MTSQIIDKRIILASKSPRRFELLKGLGIDFIVKTKEVDESFPAEINVSEVARYLADKKAAAFKDTLQESELLIAADTVVILDGEILNKPQDKNDAIRMLRKLSGRAHQVITGVCMIDVERTVSFDDRTEVHFKELEREEILYYIDRYEPFDKAGAYGVQEWIGYAAVDKMTGSFYNVMGLPTHLVYNELKNW